MFHPTAFLFGFASRGLLFGSVVLHWYRRHVTGVELSVRHFAAVVLGRHGCVDWNDSRNVPWFGFFFRDSLPVIWCEECLFSLLLSAQHLACICPTMSHDACFDFFLHARCQQCSNVAVLRIHLTDVANVEAAISDVFSVVGAPSRHCTSVSM